MAARDALALHVTPVLLRLALGAVFLWAGGSKLLYRDEVDGERAAALANLGLISPPAPAVPVVPSSPSPIDPTPTNPEANPSAVPTITPPTAPGEPIDPAPKTDQPAPAKPQATPGAEPPPVSTPRAQGSSPLVPIAMIFTLGQAEPGARITPPAAAPASAGASDPAISAPVAQPPVTPTSAPRYVASDFPKPVRVLRLYGLALTIAKAAEPNDAGRRLWPVELATPGALRAQCWAVALTEFLGGAMVLVGFLTRLWALGLAGTMVGAMILTTIGPAALVGPSFLGVLPDPMLGDASRWVAAWTPMLFQFSLALMALGLAASGAGALSIDGLLFGARAPVADQPARA